MTLTKIPRIRLLNRLLANQIAAGEVVERPASVVKELLENSLDAKAQQIEVSIQQGGFQTIKVRDDGHGIEQQDLRLAVSRHATSKIASVHDLTAIDTLGFRGEALASIAAISRFWLSSKPEQQSQAWQLHLNGLDTEVELQPTAHPTGTTIMVQDLFFNTPARRKFLRSERTEFLQIEEIFKRIALSQFSVGFNLLHNQKMVYRLLPAQTPLQQQRRVSKIFGNAFLENACYVDMHATHLALTGWLGLPKLSRSQNDLQYVYLNGRLIRDRVINHALRQAYEDLLPEGRNALYLLYLTVDPATVDVNVHPTKHEVRFHQARLVHDFIVASVRKALQQTHVPIPEIEKKTEIEEHHEFGNNFSLIAEPAVKYEPAPRFIDKNPEADAFSLQKQPGYEISNKLEITTWGKALTMVQDRWLLSEIASGILFTDIHAAQRFICARQIVDAYTNTTLCSQPLLFPQTHTLTESLLTQLLAQQEKLSEIGIIIDQLSANTIIIRGLPASLAELDSYAFLLAFSARLQLQQTIEKQEILKLSTQFIKPKSLPTLTQQQAFLADLNALMILDPTHLPEFCYHVSFRELN